MHYHEIFAEPAVYGGRRRGCSAFFASEITLAPHVQELKGVCSFEINL
jgi:hypothetical protein